MGSSFFIGPHATPKSVKILIWVTVLTSLLSPVATYFLAYFFKWSGPLQWFTLSSTAIKETWIWQPLTYFFLNSYSTNLSLSLFISLFFLMLVLWFTGSEIQSRFGDAPFLLFYLSAGLFSGLFALLLIFLFSSSQIIVGSLPPIFALVVVFALLYPNLELFFFYFFRIKAKWLVIAFLGFGLLLELTSRQYISFAADIAAIVWGYFVGRVYWKLPSPFPKKIHSQSKDKIIDISAIQENDDEFMERMLDKISTRGHDSLTSKEKARMQKISEKRKKNFD